MSDGSWIFVAVGLALIALALGSAMTAQRDLGRRMADLEGERTALVTERMDVQMATRKLTTEMVAQRARIEQLEARPEPSKHDTVALAQANGAEVALFEAGKVVDQFRVASAQMENMMLRLEWIRENGNVDAPWSAIVKWKNEKAGNK